MTTYQRIAAVFLGCLLGSSSVFADWEIQTQGEDGSWKSTGRKPTEEVARATANAGCKMQSAMKMADIMAGKSVSNSSVRIVDTDSGKEHVFQCDLKAGQLADR
ncbi:hypothetical protein LG200_02195 [Methylobacillus caricis]|uniref:hypothetical protein n=1 Tax=Methylobacillus caricis TaxID=1971611 RepID=UPI001CFF5B0B|nr:hypothetical protein [Methylobacillus caricis]MCB5186811.1 hypothetical protein [Methylobacillus caricis]